MESLFEIKNLSCGYGGKIVLRDINFKISKGEFLGIIGPNGAGKTTLIRALTRLIKPLKGHVFFEDEDIYKMGHKELAKKIAVVSQDFAANFITVEDFVLMGRIPHYKKFQFLETEKDEGIAEKSMSLTGIFALRKHPMEKISGGERQLALIARALAQEPQLLIMDEPTSHLDITHQVAILDLVKKLNRTSRITVIMVLHDLNLASEYCDKLILINRGKLCKMGKPSEVLTYQTIEEIYQTTVVVKQSPVSLKPHIFIVTEEAKG